MRLVMTLRTHDQADVIDALVAFHLNLGVDFVIATDHRSTDGTVEILESYEREGVLRLFREFGEAIKGSEWRTRMARVAALEHGADWVFSCDGDEFWWPRYGTLKDIFRRIPSRFGVVYALQRSFVPGPTESVFFAERATVRLSMLASVESPEWPFRPATKVAHRADPRVVVDRGNHAVSGASFVPLVGWFPIEVLHFPVRDKERYLAKLMAWERELGDRRGYERSDGEPFRPDESLFTGLLVDDHQLRRGAELGYLEIDTRLRDVLRRLRVADSGLRCFSTAPTQPVVIGPPSIDEELAWGIEVSALAESGLVRTQRDLDALRGRLASLERGTMARIMARVVSR